jgi:hypothetical protein
MITPSDSPSSPSNYAGVAASQVNIQAPLDDGIGPAFDSANAEGGSGVLYPMSPRIADARTLLESPAGFGADGFDITGGFHGDWPANVEPDTAGP